MILRHIFMYTLDHRDSLVYSGLELFKTEDDVIFE